MGEGREWRTKHRRVRRVRRAHGLQTPLHPQQLLAWLLMIAFISLTFGAIIPALHSSLALPVAISSGLLFLMHLITHIIALVLDPADPQLRVLNKKQNIPEFDRSVHSHVIENGRCHLCNITITSSRTKHCSACNKCVDVFDHHCKWLNHCIGKRNYKAFMVCVVTAILSCLLIMGTCIAEIVLYYFDREHLSPWEKGKQVIIKYVPKEKEESYIEPMIACEAGSPYCHFVIFGARVYDGAFIGIISALFSVALIAEVLLIHLAAFHAYISYLGFTTYEYIRGNNMRDTASAHSYNNYGRDDTSDPEGAVCGWTVVKRGPNNQITPSSTTDTALLSIPSNDLSTGPRSPRSNSTSPLTPKDGLFKFTPRSITNQESPSLRHSKETNSSVPVTVTSPRPHSSSVPTLPQIKKPAPSRSRIGLRSVNRILSKESDSDVEVRLVSIPRPRPSRRRMLKSSVAPHLSPIKECDTATASPPSLRGLSNKFSENTSNSPSYSPSRPTKLNTKTAVQTTTKTNSSPQKSSYSNSSFSPSSSPKSSGGLFSKTSPLRSPSLSQIYPRPNPTMTQTIYNGNPQTTKIFLVNEHKYNNPVKKTSKSSATTLTNVQNSSHLRSSFRCISPVENTPRLLTNVNGKNVAITILNGRIESATPISKSVTHQNGRLLSKEYKSQPSLDGNLSAINIESSENGYSFSSGETDLKQTSNSNKNFRPAKSLPNGTTTHVELHM